MLHEQVKGDERVIRISMDAKARLVFGEFSRGGHSRACVKALDHDFAQDTSKAQLFGFYLPDHNETYFYFIKSNHLTADTIVDCLEDLWRSVTPKQNHCF